MSVFKYAGLRRAGSAVTLAGLVAIGVAAHPGQARAWWHGGFGFYVPPVVVAPPVYAPPPVYYAPPAYYAPPGYYPPPYYQPRRVWVPAHWQGPYWVPGHWS